MKTKNDYQQYLKNFGFDCNFNLLPNLVRLWRFRDDQLSKVFLGPLSHEGYDLFYITEMHICMLTFLASIKYRSNDIGSNLNSSVENVSKEQAKVDILKVMLQEYLEN